MYFIKRKNVYYIEFKVDGKVKRISTRSKTIEDAKIFADRYFNKSETNSSDIQIAKKVKPSILLSKFKKEYISYLELSHSNDYLRSVKLSFRHFEMIMGDRYIDSITPKEIEFFVLSVFKRAKYASHLYYRTLKAAFNKALAWNYISENPFKKVKPPKIVKRIPNFISLNELNEILVNEPSELLRNIYLFAFYSGMRLGEIVNLKWENLDFNSNSIYIKNTEEFNTKNKQDRVVPLHPKVKEMLGRIKPKGKYVFSIIRDVKLNKDFISKRFKKAVRKTNVNPELRFHDLRHSFASNLVQQGVPLYVIKDLLGHQTISTTQIYSHLQKDNLINAVLKLE